MSDALSGHTFAMSRLAAAEHICQRLTSVTGATMVVGFAINSTEPSTLRGGPVFELLLNIDQQLRNG